MGEDSSAVARIEAAALRELFDSGTPVALLDVREPAERMIATIKTPPNVVECAVPMGEVGSSLDQIRGLAADRRVVVYCHHGQRSMVVARWLAANGVDGLSNLEGGINAWSIRVDRSTPRY